MSAINKAARDGDMDEMKRLLDSGVDIHERDTRNSLPLIEAAMMGHEAIVQLLLSRGADVNASGHNGFTALHVAAWTGMFETVQALLSHGANVHAQDDEGKTPLEFAAGRRNPEIQHFNAMELLRNAGAEEPEGGFPKNEPTYNPEPLERADAIRALNHEDRTIFFDGLTALRQQDFFKAAEVFDRLLLKYPEHMDTRYNFALALTGNAQFFQAHKQFDYAYQLDTTVFNAFLNKMSVGFHMILAADYILVGEEVEKLKSIGKYTEATSILLEYHQKNPSHYSCRTELAFILFAAGDENDAEFALDLAEGAVRLNPALPTAHFAVSVVASKLQQLHKCVDAAFRCLARTPESDHMILDLCVRKGSALIFHQAREGIYDSKLCYKVIEICNDLIALGPSDQIETAYWTRGCLLFHLYEGGDGDVAEAIPDLRRAVEMDPSDPMKQQVYEMAVGIASDEETIHESKLQAEQIAKQEAEINLRYKVQKDRLAAGVCTLCGQPLGMTDKISRRSNHARCTIFRA